MLAALSGTRHEVLTAVALQARRPDRVALSRFGGRSFKALSREEIAQYVASGECDDKAGAYAIQGRAARFIVELRGSYSGIMGLPLYETGQLLDKLRQLPLSRRHERRHPDQRHAAGDARRGHRARARCRSCTSSARSSAAWSATSTSGKVARVLPGMQSAFIDIGLERAAFLHVADIWQRQPDGDRPATPAERRSRSILVRRPAADWCR